MKSNLRTANVGLAGDLPRIGSRRSIAVRQEIERIWKLDDNSKQRNLGRDGVSALQAPSISVTAVWSGCFGIGAQD
jgi:hypothetical protein